MDTRPAFETKSMSSCTICSIMKATSISEYRLHQLTHLREKPCTCHICDENFNHVIDLKNHLLTHDKQEFTLLVVYNLVLKLDRSVYLSQKDDVFSEPTGLVGPALENVVGSCIVKQESPDELPGYISICPDNLNNTEPEDGLISGRDIKTDSPQEILTHLDETWHETLKDRAVWTPFSGDVVNTSETRKSLKRKLVGSSTQRAPSHDKIYDGENRDSVNASEKGTKGRKRVRNHEQGDVDEELNQALNKARSRFVLGITPNTNFIEKDANPNRDSELRDRSLYFSNIEDIHKESMSSHNVGDLEAAISNRPAVEIIGSDVVSEKEITSKTLDQTQPSDDENGDESEGREKDETWTPSGTNKLVLMESRRKSRRICEASNSQRTPSPSSDDANKRDKFTACKSGSGFRKRHNSHWRKVDEGDVDEELKQALQKARLGAARPTEAKRPRRKAKATKAQVTKKKNKSSVDSEALRNCTICSILKDTTISEYRLHQLTHLGEMPCRCDICYHSFNDVIDLKNHMLTHEKQEFVLFIITKRVVETDDYSARAIYGIMKDTGVSEYRLEQQKGDTSCNCDICDESFNHFKDLENHLLTHHKQDFVLYMIYNLVLKIDRSLYLSQKEDILKEANLSNDDVSDVQEASFGQSLLGNIETSEVRHESTDDILTMPNSSEDSLKDIKTEALEQLRSAINATDDDSEGPSFCPSALEHIKQEIQYESPGPSDLQYASKDNLVMETDIKREVLEQIPPVFEDSDDESEDDDVEDELWSPQCSNTANKLKTKRKSKKRHGASSSQSMGDQHGEIVDSSRSSGKSGSNKVCRKRPVRRREHGEVDEELNEALNRARQGHC